MEEESAPFITSITTWFTPALLFLFLNLMIATILFISNNPNKLPTEIQQNQTDSKLTRSPSLLHRLKSFQFYPHTSQPEPGQLNIHHHQQQSIELAASHYVFSHPFAHDQELQPDPTRIENENQPEEPEDDDLESLDEVYSKITGGNVNRTKSDTLPASGKLPVNLPAKMKKSASLKSAFSHFEEDKIVEAHRPATVRERRKAGGGGGDVEVDAKADDFINKFKNQLKLQRLDSIIRYKDMVSRGGGK